MNLSEVWESLVERYRLEYNNRLLEYNDMKLKQEEAWSELGQRTLVLKKADMECIARDIINIQSRGELQNGQG